MADDGTGGLTAYAAAHPCWEDWLFEAPEGVTLEEWEKLRPDLAAQDRASDKALTEAVAEAHAERGRRLLKKYRKMREAKR